MKTADRALTILSFFTESTPELGLSELARQAELDKATTHRMLKTLAKHGFVEQHEISRKYRLGASVLRLAQIREATVPVSALVQPILERLAAETGETAHASLIAGDYLATIGIVESTKSNRVNFESGQRLPLHATASGIAFLGFSTAKTVDTALSQDLERFTDLTVIDADKARDLIKVARATGIGLGDQGFELEVVGVAAPIFNRTGSAAGAVAVATPSSRMSEAVKRTNSAAVIRAAVAITRGMGAEPHPLLLEMLRNYAA